MKQDEIFYKLNWHPHSTMPGQHRSASLGDGFEFDSHTPLGDGVDPRRFDLLASSRDPLERLLVRQYRQTSAVDITVIADMSASMLVTRSIRKLDILAALTDTLARSVYRNGDYLAFYGCADTLLSDYLCPRTRDVYTGHELAEKLRNYGVTDSVKEDGEYSKKYAVNRSAFSIAAVDQVVSRLTPRRGVIFLVSDFHMVPSTLDTMLERLGRHRVVPLFIEDSVENRKPPVFGLTELVDIETGNRVSYFMRPGLRKRYLQAFANHRLRIKAVCDQRGCPLLTMTDEFVADDVSKYFMES